MLITAGPTHEPIDEVRYIANRSSGKMGIAIAEAARHAGWDVTLLLGPTLLNPPLVRGDETPPPLPRGGEGDQCGSPKRWSVEESRTADAAKTRTIRFTTTEDLRSLLAEHFPKCDVLVMAAAVADYRPVKSAAGKIKRGDERLTLELEATPDLVAECAKRKRQDQFIVGFALEEPDKLRERAIEKLKRKGLDAIAANPLRTMDSEMTEARLFQIAGGQVTEPRAAAGATTKKAFARWLIEWLGESDRTVHN
jgi:phosphopantothenoylcysteine decarboxylase/phosphopantothenate--cysteine ligase